LVIFPPPPGGESKIKYIHPEGPHEEAGQGKLWFCLAAAVPLPRGWKYSRPGKEQMCKGGQPVLRSGASLRYRYGAPRGEGK
jgi:hypothetical protein